MPETTSLERARGLILEHGRAATCWQILHPALSLWFSNGGDGVVGYVTYRRVRVAAGEPVCAPERLAAVGREFAQDAARSGERVCYLAAEDPMVKQLVPADRHAVAPIGAQPVWHPERLAGVFQKAVLYKAQVTRVCDRICHTAML